MSSSFGSFEHVRFAELSGRDGRRGTTARKERRGSEAKKMLQDCDDGESSRRNAVSESFRG